MWIRGGGVGWLLNFDPNFLATSQSFEPVRQRISTDLDLSQRPAPVDPTLLCAARNVHPNTAVLFFFENNTAVLGGS